jgi:hypothetical protein
MDRDLRELRTRVKIGIHDALMTAVPFEELKSACEVAQWSMVDAPGCVVPGIGLRYGIDTEVNFRWNEKPDPYRLYDVSGGWLDKRPKCSRCKKRIASPELKREIVNESGKRVTVCQTCT